jgi:hypothetical protein
MALGTHNLSSGRLKNYFFEVDESMFQVVEKPCEIVFCILGFEKIDLNEDD